MVQPASIQTLKATLNSFEPATVAGKELKSVLSLYLNMEPQLPKEDVISGLQEALPVETLFNFDVISGPTILFKVLRDYMLHQEHTYIPYPHRRELSYGIANSFFENPEDRDYALACLNHLRKPVLDNVSHSPNQSVTTSHPNDRSEENARKLAHSIAQRFKMNEDRFNGKAGEDIEEYFKTYETAILDYKIDNTSKFQYLHNLFDNEAKRFYRDNVYPVSHTYEEAKRKMVMQYNNITTQNRMRQFLKNISLSSIMDKESCDITVALEKLRSTINKYTPLGPESHRSDATKVEYLYEAVVGHSWAASALTNCYSSTPPWDFDRFCSALNAAWLQEQRRVHAQGETPTEINKSASIFWETQRSYGKMFNRYSKRGMQRNMSNVRCWNCNERGHISSKCPKKKEMTKNVNNAIRRNPKNAAKILFELCRDYDNEESKSDSSSESENESSSDDDQNVINNLSKHNDRDSDESDEDF